MTLWNVIKVDGQRVIYEYRTSWQKRYYSFDGGENWYTSKKEAYEISKANGTIRFVAECHPVAREALV